MVRVRTALALALVVWTALPGLPAAATRAATTSASRVHVVKAGDTLRAIGARYGVTIPALVAANRLSSASAPLQIGQRLTIPPAAGTASTAKKPVAPTSGRTAAVASASNGRRPQTANGRSAALASSRRTESVNGRRVEVASARATEGVNGRRVSKVNGRPMASSPPPSTLVLGLPNFSDLVPLFAWPIDGQVSSTFGLRRMGWHQGIDIKADLGTPVAAAAPGLVVASGFEPRYGRVVKIEHTHGFLTVYAHNDENRVEAGDRVMMGQTIASVGRTGHATTYHVHFEIRQGGLAYNPLYLLPLPPRVTHVEDGEEEESEETDE